MEAGHFSEEQLAHTAAELIAERGDQLDDVARARLQNQVVAELSDSIDRAIVDALPDDCLAQMAALADQPNPSEAEFSAIITRAHLNYSAIVNSAITTYRQHFLEKA